MEKKAPKIIQIAKLLAPIISSRDIIAVLKKRLLRQNHRLLSWIFQALNSSLAPPRMNLF